MKQHLISNVRILFSLFLLFEMGIFFLAYTLMHGKIDQILSNRLMIFESQLDTVQSEYHKLSRLLYNETINTEPVLAIYRQIAAADQAKRDALRQELYTLLLPTYERLKYLQLRQLHFHLPGNISFLRFHKPDKYGDDLTDIRYSITQVNETKQFVSGFEGGRAYNGFRYVFPLLDHDGTYLGSVETSLSYAALKNDIETFTGGYVQFMVKKEIVERKVWAEERPFYSPSMIHDDYLVEQHSSYDSYPNHFTQELVSELEKKLHENVKKKIDRGEKFALFVEQSGQGYAAIFLPVSNVKGEAAASYLFSFVPVDIPLKIKFDYSLVTLLVALLNALLFYFIYITMRANQQVETQKSLLKKQNIQLQNDLIQREKLEEENRQIMLTLADRVDKEVAQRMKLQDEANERERMMIQQGKMAEIGNMVSMIAHQWKQPLNLLMIYADSLEDIRGANEQDEKDLAKLVGRFHEQILFMNETVDDFRGFYRTSKEQQPFRCCEAVMFVLKLFKKQFQSYGVEVVLHEHEHFHVLGFSNEYRQVILNIVNNASDAIREKGIKRGRIDIWHERTGKMGTIRIRDNGGGIQESLLPDLLFDPHSSTKGEKGTGIGLYLVKTIIEKNMGGHISVHNVEGGAEFVIELPIIEDY